MFRRLFMLITAALSLFIAVEAFVPHAAAQQDPRLPSFGRPAADDSLVSMKAIADTNQLTAGETIHLVFVFDIEKTWHLYWKNPGAGAAPIDVSITAPDGFDVKPVRFPRPEVFKSSTGDIYGYDKQVAVFVPITVPLELSTNAAVLQYEVTWAVCDDQRCVLQRRSGTLAMTTAGDPATANPLITKFKNQLPIDATNADDVVVQFDGSKLSITGPAKGQTTASFFPDPTPGVSFEDAELAVKDDQFVLTATVFTKPGNFAGTKPFAAGLIGLGEERQDPSFEFSIALKK